MVKPTNEDIYDKLYPESLARQKRESQACQNSLSRTRFMRFSPLSSTKSMFSVFIKDCVFVLKYA